MGTPVIDLHCHVGSVGHYGFYAHPDRYVRVLDDAGIDRACINCIWYGDARHANDLVASFMADYPERFIGVAFVTPHYPEEAIGELERAFDELGMKFLKIYATYLGRPHDDPAYFPIFEWCNDRGIAVLHHASYPFDGESVTVPLRYEALSKRFPRVKWVLAHSGSGGSLPRQRGAVEAARTIANVYLETASSGGEPGDLEAVVEAVGADRVLYGSDMTMHDPRQQVGKIVTADISEEAKRKILGLNAIKLLGLED